MAHREFSRAGRFGQTARSASVKALPPKYLRCLIVMNGIVILHDTVSRRMAVIDQQALACSDLETPP